MKSKKEQRLGKENISNQGCIMKIIEYNNYDDIIVEFQDKHKAKVHTKYGHFKNGGVKNPYYPSVLGVGMLGIKYPSWVKGRTKEYAAWRGILQRCFDCEYKNKKPTYKNVTCCKEWLYFENFYEWLHSQDNFDKWSNEEQWNVDKDILVKGNKLYSPETCCLVPSHINSLFTKCDNRRGNLPIGVAKNGDKFIVELNKNCRNTYIGTYLTPEEAFLAYKKAKEYYIKQVAKEEYNKGNITKQCYNAMMKYEVEITD